MSVSKKIIIIGAGGHAKVLAESLLLCNRTILGFTTESGSGEGIFDLPILGTDESLSRYTSQEVACVIGIGGTRANSLREALSKKISDKGFEILSVIDSRAQVSPRAVCGSGVQILCGAIVQTSASIGDYTIINTGAIIEHDCRIGSSVHVASGAVLAGQVSVGARSHVGAGAVVIQGRTIGQDVTVGAGAVVINDITDGLTVMGVPARARQSAS